MKAEFYRHSDRIFMLYFGYLMEVDMSNETNITLAVQRESLVLVKWKHQTYTRSINQQTFLRYYRKACKLNPFLPSINSIYNRALMMQKGELDR